MPNIKTATLTFHAPNNNGSFLQAYALQKTLLGCGIDNKIIDLYTDKQMSQYSVFRKPKSVGDIVRNVMSVFHYSGLKRRFSRFDDMRKQYLRMTNRCKTDEEVYAVIPDYDVLICGSDQIWNTEARDFSDAYFLPGIEKKKVTYAVSCGSHINEVNKEKLIRLAAAFSSVSVREKSTADFLIEKGLESVDIVLDPTLLLKKEDYNNMYDSKPIVKGRYILLYTINYNDEVLRTVQKLAKIYNLPVYAPFTGYSAYKCRKYGIKVLYDVAPDKFLNLMENASYVCSNSFHGIAFSIIFRKEFFRLCNTDSDGKMLTDDRIDGILTALNLQSRNICESNMGEIKDIDYTHSDIQLDEMRKFSKEYLLRAIKG